jgi:ABC-type sugar transport system substrate-binding protein
MDLVRIAAALAALAALAGLLAGSAPAAAAAERGGDPNRQICKSKPVVGSRLKRIRECHSAAEWDDLKLAEQIGLGRQQYNGADGLGSQENYLPPGRSLEPPQ